MAAKVHHLELNNFKSYNGRILVGPFHDFDCIVGPNGSGKSNIMDALSFVLGSAAQTLRMEKPEDLINHKCKKGEASVSLVLKTPNGTEINLTRKVNSKGKMFTSVDGKDVPEKDFAQTLRKHRIGARTSSFLVFQHEVDAVAQKKAKELTELVEEVSGSGELKAEYNEKKRLMDAANEELATASITKRTAIAEVNQMRLHKKEAERFAEVNDKLVAERRDLALTELFHIEVQLNKQKVALANQTTEVDTLQRSITSEDEIKAMKKKYAELHKTYTENLKLNRQASIELREKKGTLERITASIEHFTKRLDREQEELRMAKDNNTVRSKETARLEEQLRGQEAAMATFEEKCKKEDAEAAKHGKLSEKHLAEYKELKKEADCKTITARQELDIVLRKGESLEEGAKQLKLASENQQANRADVLSHIHRTETRIAESRTKLTELEASADDLRAKATEARNNLTGIEAKQREREEELAKVQNQLHELRHTKEDNRHAERVADALQSLRTMYSGVKGRLVDLCTIPNARYRNAVTVAMGKNLEAIVVDTTATAMSCVRYLKEQRISAMTFIPLEAATGKAVDDRLRAFGRTCKPAVDVIKFDGWLEPAIRYALGQTLVCDNMREAKDVAYGHSSGERFKVVTVDGSMLLKNGSIQGGQSTIEARAKKWDERQYDNLKAERDRLIAEGGGGADAARCLIEAKDAESRAVFAANRAKTIKEEIVALEAKLKNYKVEIKKQDDSAADLKKRVEAADKHLKENDAQKQKMEKHIHEQEAEVFREFQKKVGIPNIAELEERQTVLAKTRAEKRQQFKVLIHKLQTSIDAEKKRVGVKDPKELASQVAATEGEIKSRKKDHSTFSNIVAKVQEKQETAQTEVTKAKAALTALEDEIRRKGKASESDVRKMTQARKTLTMLQSACDGLRQQRLSLYQRCRLEDVDMPTAAPSKDATKQRKRGRHGDEEESEEVASPTLAEMRHSEAFTSFSTSEGTRGAKEAPVCIDFAVLPEAIRRVAADKHSFDGHKHRAETLIDQLERELESIAPNLKASDRFTSSEAKLGATSSTLENAREKQRKALAEFTRVKTERTNRFMTCFDKIVDDVDRVYRELTMSVRAEGVHGSAHLSLEDAEEPYNGGTKYHATPPMKRFITIDQLSGGERTMAALALLFAIHNVSPAPFFVLDEVDAALDAANVQKLAHYLHNHRMDCQFLVVSLKDQLYHIADSLVGVYKDHQHQSSGILTFDLRDVPS